MVCLSYRSLRATCSRGCVIKGTQVEKHTISSTCSYHSQVEGHAVLYRQCNWWNINGEQFESTALTFAKVAVFPYFSDGRPAWKMKPWRWSSHSTTGDNSFFEAPTCKLAGLSIPTLLCICVFYVLYLCICGFVYLQSDHPSFCCANIILKYVTGNYWEILTFCQNKLTSFSPQRFSLMKCEIICSF